LWKEHNVAAIHESGFQWLVKHAKRVGGSYKESNGIIYRVYFPVYVEAEIPNSIQFALARAGYRIDADSPEYCIDKHGRRVSVNKAYQLSAKKQHVDSEVIKDSMQEYAENLGSAGVMLLCVSRHPYDIAGMSTGRAAWSSCHTLGGDGPKEKARKKAKYAKEMAAYKKELAEWGVDNQRASALREKYLRELEEFRQEQDLLVADVNEARRHYDQALVDANNVTYRLDHLVDEIVNSINAGQRKIIADSVSKNTGIPETIAEDAVAVAMHDEYAIDDIIRYKLVVKSLPNITPQQRNFFDINETKGGFVRVFLKYTDKNTSVIQGLKRVSRPGKRVYSSYENIPTVRGAFGTSILSTSKGIMTDEKAKTEKVGGEVLCQIW
jgi:small subunit ribosomal protein S8